MTVLSTTLGETFTPTKPEFNLQVNGGVAYLWRKNSNSAAFAPVRGNAIDGAVIVDNGIDGAASGASYKLLSDQTVTFTADE